MKKLLVFREGVHPDPRELDDFLYDSELFRSDFLDLSPEEKFEHYSDNLSLHTSTWEVVFKDDDKYDFWHFLCVGSDTYAFDEPAFIATFDFFPKELINVRCCNCRAVFHKDNYMVVIYRLPKAVSHLVDLHLKYRLESFKDGKYHYDLPKDDLGSVNVQMEEAEVSEGDETSNPKHRTRS